MTSHTDFSHDHHNRNLLEGQPGSSGQPLATPVPIPAVNWHCWAACNMVCRFCFTHFGRQGIGDGTQLTRADMMRLAPVLGSAFPKLNFAGGEPTLCPWLTDLVAGAAAAGAVTSVVSNGSRLDRTLLDALAASRLGWLCLSVDSVNAEVNLAHGRAVGGRSAIDCERLLLIAELARERGIRIKLNTVITTKNWEEDLAPFITAFRPERWKILRLLPMLGENDACLGSLLPSAEQFASYRARHQPLAGLGIDIVGEDHEDMRGSYLMIDPAGRFYDSIDGHLRVAPKGILDVGLEAALVEARYNVEGFHRRGGLWAWGQGA